MECKFLELGFGLGRCKTSQHYCFVIKTSLVSLSVFLEKKKNREGEAMVVIDKMKERGEESFRCCCLLVKDIYMCYLFISFREHVTTKDIKLPNKKATKYEISFLIWLIK